MAAMLHRPLLTSTISRILGAASVVSVAALLVFVVVRENGKVVEKSFAPIGHGGTWAEATAAQVKLFTAGEGGDSLAQAIQQIVRPSKRDVRPIMRDVRVVKLSADRIEVDLNIACDTAPAAEQIHVFWEFDKDHHIRARLLPVGGADVEQLDAYLRDRVYPRLR